MTLAALTPVLADPESPMFAKPGSSIPDTPEHFTFPDCEVPVLSLPEIPGTDILDPLDFISPLSESPAPPSTKEVIANDERPTRFRLTHFCPECLAGFTNKGKLAEHMISVHNIDRPVKCDSCDASFRSPLNFARHKRIHETDKHFSCDLCSYSSSQKSNLTLHRRRHTKNYAYQCELCGCGFMQRTKYVEHQQRHEGQGYECKICKNVFNYRRNLVAHVKGCHPETLGSYQGKLLRCEFCHRDFTNEISRKRHQRQMHASLLEPKKKCLCDICGMQLSSPTALRIHIRGHSGEKVAKCDDCGKAFTKWTNLKIHQRVHTGEKPYVCTQCGKGFTQKTTLVYHTRVHTGERPYSCDVCGKGFVSNSLLRKHANTHEKAIEKQKQVVA